MGTSLVYAFVRKLFPHYHTAHNANINIVMDSPTSSFQQSILLGKSESHVIRFRSTYKHSLIAFLYRVALLSSAALNILIPSASSRSRRWRRRHRRCEPSARSAWNRTTCPDVNYLFSFSFMPVRSYAKDITIFRIFF